METIKKAGRAIIEKNCNGKKCIISIKRTINKDKKEKIYYTLPGGHVENNETFEETTIREVFEELGINVKIEKEVAHLFNEYLNKDEIFFSCNYIDGNIGTGTGSEFTENNIDLYGKYEIEYIDVNEINNYNLLPEKIKDILVKKYS